ncbi:MAG: baseplate J/gp47 family protein [Tepidanaerobacter acetatoxydans]|uniref:baseplate assembly protein n=1 Tax=Tepidanaerobacter acetatoxydans TaxID=499229 RepID=UPI0026F043D1|nr:baseplate J/gp47 family protein [Tepidanaerobacter acetatoxydans]NLU09451.1 baseplate J/gp47 family protein [Tepidanaerobacter acetatoxydans]
MKNIYDLQDIEFVEMDLGKIEAEAVTMLEEELGKPLYPGAPERLLMLCLLSIIIQQRALINDTGKQNLLAFSRETYLERIGDLVGEEREKHAYAYTTLKFTLSTALNFVHIIPKGTKVTADGLVYFEVEEDVEIPIGETEVETIAKCTAPGAIGNGFLPGQINQIVKPFPFFQSVENTTMSYGGLDEESDDQLRQKIHEAPEGFSTAGPDGAYKYYARKASPLIIDVEAHSPSPGVVEVVPLLENGDIPTDEIIEQVYEICNSKEIRPLTDKLVVSKPPVVYYDLNVEYWISEENKPFINQINQNVIEAISEYELWQKSKLGRDINPSKLIEMLMRAGAKRVNVISPAFLKLEKTQIAHLRNKDIVYKGVEND